LIGKYEKSCLDILEDIIKFKIDRNIQLIGYFPDGYIKELNLVIEFDEEHHNWTYQKNIDIKKDLDYNKVGLNVIRIKKVDWDKDQNKCIQEFCAKIRDLKISLEVPS
jgi:very-short-patch-repair endonuclease